MAALSTPLSTHNHASNALIFLERLNNFISTEQHYYNVFEAYERNTFPVLVSCNYRVESLICTTTEPFDQFKIDLKNLFSLEGINHAEWSVNWGQGLSSSTILTAENFYASLRMLKANPGKCEIFTVCCRPCS